MKIKFEKYEGTGNDFVIIDNRNYNLSHSNTAVYKNICDRKFGFGADGILFLEQHSQYAFEMIYLNADGNISTMCGNGGRCLAHFAHKHNICKSEDVFYAADGEHHFNIDSEMVKLKLLVYEKIDRFENDYLVETGSPHYVKFCKNINKINLLEDARKIRYNNTFAEKGINVNFVESNVETKNLKMRTYERGVENETLSCGTGTVAVAMAAKKHIEKLQNENSIAIETKGGNLNVNFQNNGVWLTGPATFVFEGEIEIEALTA